MAIYTSIAFEQLSISIQSFRGKTEDEIAQIIKKAYRDAMFSIHPDHNPDLPLAEAQEKTRVFGQAKTLLLDYNKDNYWVKIAEGKQAPAPPRKPNNGDDFDPGGSSYDWDIPKRTYIDNVAFHQNRNRNSNKHAQAPLSEDSLETYIKAFENYPSQIYIFDKVFSQNILTNTQFERMLKVVQNDIEDIDTKNYRLRFASSFGQPFSNPSRIASFMSAYKTCNKQGILPNALLSEVVSEENLLIVIDLLALMDKRRENFEDLASTDIFQDYPLAFERTVDVLSTFRDHENPVYIVNHLAKSLEITEQQRNQIYDALALHPSLGAVKSIFGEVQQPNFR